MMVLKTYIFFGVVSLFFVTKVVAWHLDFHVRHDDIESIYEGPPTEGEIIEWANGILAEGKSEGEDEGNDTEDNDASGD
jgi:hypothetical protein